MSWIEDQKKLVDMTLFYAGVHHLEDLKAYIATYLPILGEQQLATIGGLLGVDMQKIDAGPYQWFPAEGARLKLALLEKEIWFKKWNTVSLALEKTKNYQTVYKVAQTINMMQIHLGEISELRVDITQKLGQLSEEQLGAVSGMIGNRIPSYCHNNCNKIADVSCALSKINDIETLHAVSSLINKFLIKKNQT